MERVFEYSVSHRVKDSPTLLSAKDEKDYFHSKFSHWKGAESNKLIHNALSVEWNNFLKSFARDMADRHWYNPCPFNKKVFFSLLKVDLGMDFYFISELESLIREPTRSKKKNSNSESKKEAQETEPVQEEESNIDDILDQIV